MGRTIFSESREKVHLSVKIVKDANERMTEKVEVKGNEFDLRRNMGGGDKKVEKQVKSKALHANKG